MAQKLKAFRGDTITGTATLRVKDIVDPAKTNNYVLPPSSIVKFTFPGTSTSVVLSTTDSEVVVVTSNPTVLSFTMSPAKSELLKLGANQGVDVIVDEGGTGDDIKTWQQLKIIDIEDRVNPLP